MTTPDSDQELERLFSVGREATMADPGARDRVRAGLSARLALGAPAARRAWYRRTWLGVGVGVLGLGAILWLRVEPKAGAGSATFTPALAPLPPAVTAPPRLTATAPAAVEAAPASVEVASATPPLPLRKPAPSSTHDAGLPDELSLVRAMQQALRSGDSARALTLASEHEHRFPSGTLAEEREGVRAVAQCQLAAPSARASILQTFARRHPSSPYAARVQAVCQ
jgi:hypothetical protein